LCDGISRRSFLDLDMAQCSRRHGGRSKFGAGHRIRDGILGVRVILVPFTQLFVADWPAMPGLELPEESLALIGVRVDIHAREPGRKPSPPGAREVFY
jgi:hypothetical protein